MRRAARRTCQLLSWQQLQVAELSTGTAHWQATVQQVICRQLSTSEPSSSMFSAVHTAAAARSAAEPQRWDDTYDKAAMDPYAIVSDEVNIVSERLRHSVISHIPALRTAAEYFFRPGIEGKRLRPTLTLLMASALSDSPPSRDITQQLDLRPPAEHANEPRRRQQRIAEIGEMIHVASLLHDDVIDDASTRRGVLSLNSTMGNKTAILAGDFLLARASVSLAALRNTEIVELLSQVLEHLVSGEIMQMTASEEERLDLEHYLSKTFCKTASLMANTAKAVAVLGDQPPHVCELAWKFGRHLGLAFQIVDDVLDLTASSSMLGKPALNDMRSGLATAPVLFAAQEQSELKTLILRKFKHDNDVTQAMLLIQKTNGIQRAKDLAAHHAGLAADMVRQLPQAQTQHAAMCREALIAITSKVLTRSK